MPVNEISRDQLSNDRAIIYFPPRSTIRQRVARCRKVVGGSAVITGRPVSLINKHTATILPPPPPDEATVIAHSFARTRIMPMSRQSVYYYRVYIDREHPLFQLVKRIIDKFVISLLGKKRRFPHIFFQRTYTFYSILFYHLHGAAEKRENIYIDEASNHWKSLFIRRKRRSYNVFFRVLNEQKIYHANIDIQGIINL